MFDSEVPLDARSCVDEMTRLERMKSSICARQAQLANRLDDLSQGASDRGIGAQVALARRESPHRGRTLLSLARGLEEMPRTRAALASGEINEHRAEILVREAQDLSYDDVQRYDDTLAADTGGLMGLGDTEVQLAAQRVVMRTDEAGATRRRARARGRRRVTSRRLADGLAQVTAVVADHHAAAIMGSLHERAALELTLADKTGEDRSRAQIIADLVVERLTGQVTATAVPVTIDLVVSAETLLGGGDEPGEVTGCGPVPAGVARKLALASPEQATKIRRLFADTDHLVAMESSTSSFNGLLRTFVRLRDQICRTPWCGARILHTDHVRQVALRGPTSAANGQGLCESCNYTKEEPGWRQRVTSGPVERHEVETTTPTGHVHHSRAPATTGVHHHCDDPRSHWEELRPGVWTPIAA